eukprot:GHVH01016941.1.p1 GENE.GHVH01016941.1~~GHVH01016941.1.p1  ORF type:complete len:189 (+),score=22.87 GHVH01016941.1:148-714(+)
MPVNPNEQDVLTAAPRSDKTARPDYRFQEPTSSRLTVSPRVVIDVPSPMPTVDMAVHHTLSKRRRYQSCAFISLKLITVGLIICFVVVLMMNQTKEDVDKYKNNVSALKGYRLSAPILYFLLYSSLIAGGISGETMNVLGGYLFGRLMGVSVYGSEQRGMVIGCAVCGLGTFCGTEVVLPTSLSLQEV